MRVLVIADEYPWPTRTGYRQRLAWMLRTLAADAEVDFVAVVLDERAASASPPSEVVLGRSIVVSAGRRREPRLRRLARWICGSTPRALLWRDWTAPRRVLAGWSDTGYDLVWFSHGPCYLALADLVTAPHVVDLDNLESMALHHRRRLPARGTASIGQRLGAAVRSRSDAVDERRWRRLEGEVASRATAVVVCSRLDQGRLDRANVFVVPNGYELDGTEAARAPGQEPRPGGPVLLMVGLLTYAANQDAAAFFADEILPRVRESSPGAQFRVVGRYDSDDQIAALRGRPGVTPVGEVADLNSELAAADIAVVPIRFGGGTRIKILEAFANGIPVVTTTVGCEGLDVVDGQHLVIADDPAEFAAACVRLCANADLRASVIAEARGLWAARYRWTSIGPTITAVAHGASRG